MFEEGLINHTEVWAQLSYAKWSKDRYFQEHHNESKKLIPEGIEGRVPIKAP